MAVILFITAQPAKSKKRYKAPLSLRLTILALGMAAFFFSVETRSLTTPSSPLERRHLALTTMAVMVRPWFSP
jgi:hypothetical protein